MNALRPQFPGHALCQRPQGELGAGERGETATAAQRRGGAGEQDGATAARHHHPGRLPAGEKAGERGHFPHLAVDPGGGLADRKMNIGADIENHHLQRPHFGLDGVHQGLHLIFVAGVAAEAAGLPALLPDTLDQRRQGVLGAAGDTGGEAFTGKTSGNGAAGGVTGADHKNRGGGHGVSLYRLQRSTQYAPASLNRGKARPTRTDDAHDQPPTATAPSTRIRTTRRITIGQSTSQKSLNHPIFLSPRYFYYHNRKM